MSLTQSLVWHVHLGKPIGAASAGDAATESDYRVLSEVGRLELRFEFVVLGVNALTMGFNFTCTVVGELNSFP